ncbi:MULTISPECIES: SDR family oxidoreductase [Acidaminococcus]|jgi:3-oxoacyl-[acyl-carrier protein] reductase|uniref:SDR family oxidoreductase n=1 Tax=Acidaminococcus TaxID=904 RepID=UPI0022E7ADA0|nr:MULTISPECIES: SDR family oxidoreductase [Acidaminococcus]
MDLGLKGKVALVLSSASGIGKGIATEFAREGAKVVIATAEAYKADLEKAQQDIEKETGNRPYTYFYDVKDPDSITKMVTAVGNDLGGLYALVNHCPGPKAGTFENLTEADWADGYEKCLHSYTFAIRAALPFMKAAGEGRILNSTSSSIKQALDNLILSNTFRMGVVGMSKTLARELGQYGVLVNTMGPGRIYTARIAYLNGIRAQKAGLTEEEYTKRDCASFPQKRYQTVEEYGRTAVFLCSPANTGVSGQYLLCDGAMTQAY